MKKISTPPPRCKFTAAVAAVIIFNGMSFSQSGQKFATGLNSLNGNDALGSSNNFPLVIKTNSTEWLRITPTGNVGIGLTNPTDKLHVAGTARMLNAMVDNQVQSFSVIAQTANFSTAIITGQLSAGSLTVSGNASVSGQLSVSDITSPSGNISLGNSNLSTTGNVNSTNISSLQTTDSILNSQLANITSSQWTTLDTSSISYSGDVFVNSLNAQNFISIGAFKFSNGATPAPIKRDSIYAPNKLVIGSQEKAMELAADTVTMKELVGIGKRPVVALDVLGDIAASGNMRLQSLSGTGNKIVFADSLGNLKTFPPANPQSPSVPWETRGNDNIQNTADFIGTLNAADLIFKTNVNDPANLTPEVMRITSNGNVGIGTAAPSQKLEVAHDDLNGGIVLNRLSSSTAKSEIKFNQNGVQKWAIGNDFQNNGTQNFFIWDHAATATRFLIDPNGKIFIGNFAYPCASCTTGLYKLYVEGGIATRDVKVTALAFPDYVFRKGYKLMSLQELENYILINGHHPGMPSEKEVKKNGGFEVGDMQIKFLKIIEEQTLYIIDLQKQIDALNKKVEQLSNNK